MRLRDLMKEEFHKYIIAQDDDCDYQESGYVILLVDGEAAIASYSHCSCFGTASAICDANYNKDGVNTPQFEWTGTFKELLYMAHHCMDPKMPMRMAEPNDCDYDHLRKVYDQLLDKYRLEALMFEELGKDDK